MVSGLIFILWLRILKINKIGQIEKERFFTMADAYNRMTQILVPKYDFLQSEALFN